MVETRQDEALNLHLQFACTAQGECDREFFCINPTYLLFPVCPRLVAWDGLAKSLRDQGIPLVKNTGG